MRGRGHGTTQLATTRPCLLWLQLRKEVAALEVSGPAPDGRGYHSFTALGQRCYAIGGRTTHNQLYENAEMVAVFDVPSRRWLPPGGQQGAGAAERGRQARSAGAAGGPSSLGAFTV